MQWQLVDGAAVSSAAATRHASATNSHTDSDTPNDYCTARYDHTIGNCDATWYNAARDDAAGHHHAGEHAGFDDRPTHADYDPGCGSGSDADTAHPDIASPDPDDSAQPVDESNHAGGALRDDHHNGARTSQPGDCGGDQFEHDRRAARKPEFVQWELVDAVVIDHVERK